MLARSLTARCHLDDSRCAANLVGQMLCWMSEGGGFTTSSGATSCCVWRTAALAQALACPLAAVARYWTENRDQADWGPIAVELRLNSCFAYAREAPTEEETGRRQSVCMDAASRIVE